MTSNPSNQPTRVIKFRAWIQKDEYDENEKPEMEMCYDLAFDDYEPINDLLTSVEHLMQFTGLTDKNGKEIYELDVVTRDYIDHKVKFVVKWIDGYACFAFVRYDVYIDGENHYFQKIDKDNLEVIGNIYENGDLL